MKAEQISALNLATTGELLDELFKRGRNALFIVSCDGTAKNTVRTECIHFGSVSEILGLIKYAEMEYTKAAMECLSDT